MDVFDPSRDGRTVDRRFKVSHNIVKKLLKKHTYVKCKALKKKAGYEIKRKVVAGFKDSMQILFDLHLGQSNYVAVSNE